MRAHLFDSTGAAYDTVQTDDNIRAGDVLIIASEKVIGVAYTWPFAVTKDHGKLHCPVGCKDSLIQSFLADADYPHRDAVLTGIGEAAKLAAQLGW